MPSLNKIPTAIAGGGGVIGRNLIVDNETRPPDQRVDYRLVVEPAVQKYGLEWLVGRVRHSIRNRPLQGDVRQAGNDAIEVNGRKIRVYDGRDIPHGLYDEEGVGQVMETTGLRVSADQAKEHGYGRDVIITANAKGAPNIVMGVNEETFNPETDEVVGNASCTTKSCVAVGKALAENFGVVSYSLVTTHAHTGPERAELTENLETGVLPQIDAKEDLEDDEPLLSAAYEFSVEPTGAGEGIGLVVPALRDKVTSALAIRGPVINGSFTTISFVLKREATKNDILGALTEAARRNPNNLQLVNIAPSSNFRTTADIRDTKADGVVLVDQIKGNGRFWTLVIGYNNEEAPARAANDLALYVEQRLAA